MLPATQDKAVVFVCNHQSTLDIMIMYRLSWHFKWVSKSSNFRIPLIGWNMGLNDYVPVTRGNADSIEKIITETAGTTISERGATRLDDQASEAAMEQRKKEGYF